MRIKHHRIPIYKKFLTLIESSDVDKVNAYFEKIGCDWEREQIYAHMVVHNRKIKGIKYRCIYVVLNRKNIDKLTHGVIAHECTHVADEIFHRMGEERADECYAYLVEYLVDVVCEFLNLDNEI